MRNRQALLVSTNGTIHCGQVLILTKVRPIHNHTNIRVNGSSIASIMPLVIKNLLRGPAWKSTGVAATFLIAPEPVRQEPVEVSLSLFRTSH